MYRTYVFQRKFNCFEKCKLTQISGYRILQHTKMDLNKNSSTDWCQDNFDQDGDINRPGPSGLKNNTGHFVVTYLMYLVYCAF